MVQGAFAAATKIVVVLQKNGVDEEIVMPQALLQDDHTF